MHTGIVTKWIEHRGFGFIRPDDGSADCFVHVSATNGKPLQAGDRVSFQPASDTRRRSPIAAEVRVIG